MPKMVSCTTWASEVWIAPKRMPEASAARNGDEYWRRMLYSQPRKQHSSVMGATMTAMNASVILTLSELCCMYSTTFC